ncbi:guanylate kinase [Clostridium sp. 'deep sea']|uniref:guanylate kinase n=1 Tax=Clostridium sp. 'deep sea' TaxID=2779445 RepID=UPI0018968A97|nr:guanylate kinase [Clostridium sp. 'deep sea']QOR36196.1 guanylate kinase [Clostridium sp. 'deep sea']
MSEGILLVLCGPSGVGKGTIKTTLLNNFENLKESISITSRKSRVGEVEGEQYYFTTAEKFNQLIENEELLEWAMVHDNYYGTPKKPIEEALNKGYDVLLEIDVQGALQIKENFERAVLVFLLPPSMQELEKRLRERGTESEEQIKRRLITAEWELTMVKSFDYVIINTVLESAIQDVESILRAVKLQNKDDKGVCSIAH